MPAERARTLRQALPRAWPTHLGSARWLTAWLLVLALGVWLRLNQLLDQTLSDDEWHAVHLLRDGHPLQFMLSTGQADHSIPLTALAWLWMRFSSLSEFVLRLPMLLAGVASLLVLPAVLVGHGDRRTRWVLALLMAVSAMLIGYSRMARPYALTLLMVFGGFALLARAQSQGRLLSPPGLGYAVLAALASWLHALMLPFVVAPLMALAWQRVRARQPLRDLLLLGLLTLALLGLAILPPLLQDPTALAAKAGQDLPRWRTMGGIWYMWIGTGSTAVLLIVLGLAALGAGDAWRSGPVFRWALLGVLLVEAAVLVTRPAWVSNTVTQARYLLPGLPCLLLAASAGLVRLMDRLAPTKPAFALMAASSALAAALLWSGPAPQLWRHPNGHTSSYYYQFDYRPHDNVVVAAYEAHPGRAFWRQLSASPRGSLVVAVAPFRLEGYAWPAPIWERESGQRVVAGYLVDACSGELPGELPRDRRFAFRNAVYLADSPAALARSVDVVAYERSVGLRQTDGQFRPAPACETWLREHFGQPDYEDADWLAWDLNRSAR